MAIDVGENQSGETCALDVAKLVGAGKNADVNGDLILIMGCKPNEKIPLVYGGADNANVNGNVELTITSGIFGKVFGGNNETGAIRGHIKLNIEETGNCGTPIEIDELYLGGNEAAYSMYGYYVKTKSNNSNATLIGASDETADLNPTNGKLVFLPRLSADDSHLPVNTYSYDETNGWTWTTYPITGNGAFVPYAAPVLNVISCTRIGQVFGGGLGETAIMCANPTVNINMLPGDSSDKIKRSGSANAHDLGEIGVGYSYKDENNNTVNVEGGVFGGGNKATVYGNTTVNIGTATSVKMTSVTDLTGVVRPDRYSDEGTYINGIVEGAYISGNVYGGGNQADVTGNTFVNICAYDDPATTAEDYASVKYSGTDFQGVTIKGSVFGGGKGLDDSFFCEKAMVGEDGKGVDSDFKDDPTYLNGNTHVTIGNGTVGTLNAQGKLVEGTGNVYGGGEIGRVEKDTWVTIGVGEANATAPTSAPNIMGDVFGGGKGKKTHGYAALVRGNPTVTIQADAKVGHSVYGAGEIASVARYRVPKNEEEVAAIIAQYPNAKVGMPIALVNNTCGYCTVKVQGNAEIGPDNMKMYHATNNVIPADDKPDDAGHVFAAGKGFLPENYTYADKAHKPYRMMLYNSTDYKDENKDDWSFIKEYSTAEIENSAINKYVWEYFPDREAYITFIQTQALASNTEVTIDGNAFVKGSVYGGSENGLVQYDTKVYIKGGQIGCGKNTTNRHVDDYADVWDDDFVLPANVNLECASWDYGKEEGTGDNKKKIFAPYDPYANAAGDLDKYPAEEGQTAKSTEGGRRVATDGHTFYGNVFGGGSGSVPYFDTSLGRSVYLNSAGTVKRNTTVEISGGHILTNVYGGCEATNVLGKATIKMTGGTIGVPRTLQQIVDHPVTCYLFGAGKGDQRVFFNKDTNVEDVEMTISGGTIYGSVYGGGEDGHVMHDVKMTIEEKTTTTGEGANATSTTTSPTIGTFGTSYFDGNVFGGGRGFGGDAYTAGNVAGSIKLEIKGGTMLGSVYGGGRLGSVGYGLYESTETETATTHKMYGEMQDDGYGDWYKNNNNAYVREEISDFKRGHVEIEISGGTIGNDAEFKYYTSSVNTNGKTAAEIATARAAELENLKAADGIPYTEFEYNESKGYYMLTHTKGGNVFAGGMGRFYELDGTTHISSVNWWKLGCVKSTKLTITGGEIKSNVYGGGELGQVVGHHDVKDSEGNTVYTDENNTTAKVTGTEIIIQGSNTVIGTEVKDASNYTQYTFGSVFGSGYGSLDESITVNGVKSYPKYIAGLVEEDTKIDMQNGAVKASIYGGGEMASINGSTDVAVSNGTIGIAPITVGSTKRYFGGAKMGNVYGGGSGHGNTVRSGRILKNTNVAISGNSTRIYHNVYGGGAYGTVGEFDYDEDENNNNKVIGVNSLKTEGTGVATVTITGGTIGYDGKENGMVFGSSRGDVNAPGQRDDHTAWVYDTHVTIGTAATPASGTEGEDGYVPATAASGPEIKGTVYGSGENGHVFHDTEVNINGGTIGIYESTDPGYTVISNGTSYSGAAYPYRGNVYGGGCGTDKYYSGSIPAGHTYNDGEGDSFNPLAGIVYGNTRVNINGGTVVRNVYGAGAMGSVGRTVTTTNTDNSTTTTYSGGSTTIYVNDGTIGVSGTVGDGSVFGAARGDLSATGDYISQVRETNVNVSGGQVKGNVYGGGELGDVGTIDKSDQTNYNYNWKDKDGNANAHGTNTISGTNNNTGICTVTVSGGTIGTDATTANADGTFDNGNVFGGGKGSESTWWCEKAIAYSTNVKVTAGTVKGSVYGGGEVGRVEDDAMVTIGLAENDAPKINGSVFGAGKGLKTHGYSALVRGNAKVTVQGKSEVEGSVFGGGEIASVGKFNVVGGLPKEPKNGGTCTVIIQDEAKIGSSGTGHNVFGACKGVTPAYNNTVGNTNRSKSMQLYDNRPKNANGTEKAEHEYWDYYKSYPQGYTGHKFVWVYYSTEADYLAFLKTLALTSNTHVTIDEAATVYGSVFGGGERGVTLGGVDVNIDGGTVNEDVYGGGSLADSNTAMWDAEHNERVTYVELPDLIPGTSATGYYTAESANALITDADATVQANTTYYANYKTNVNLRGGKIVHDAYGGALGKVASSSNATDGIAAYVYGDVTVKLNEGKTAADKGCIVDRIFGCNNLNGTPKGKAEVYVYATQNKTKVDDKRNANIGTKYGKHEGAETLAEGEESTYDVAAVYGGGNLSPYVPADADVDANSALVYDGMADSNPLKARIEAAHTYVYIDGCELTSIKQVYAGGNAAPAPATNVEVRGSYEIEELFGGGNGFDSYTVKIGDNTKYYNNPGANVGYKNYTHWGENAGTEADPYEPIDNDDASTETLRKAKYRYGSGIANAEIYGGRIHYAYGGSNEKGNISTAVISKYDGITDCAIDVDETYGGGKNSLVDGDVQMDLGCVQNMTEIFGGAKNADVNSNITLNITNGTFQKVFGGNNTSGAINGSITVNIKEEGCTPIIIDELYAGGYLAPYSVYGYQLKDDNSGEYDEEDVSYIDSDGQTQSHKQRIPLTTGSTRKNDPRINVISATRIDNIFGGGYQAKVVGNPHINVNMERGKVEVTNKAESGDPVYKDNNGTVYTSGITTTGTGDDQKTYATLPIGTIGNVYGGGNMADIVGNTYVEIGTGRWIQWDDNGNEEWVTEDASGNKYTYKLKPKTQESAPDEWAWYNASNEEVDDSDLPTTGRKTAVITSIKDDEGNVVKEGGNVYGGGNQGDVSGNTYVNICAYENDNAATTDVIEYTAVPISSTANQSVTIGGNVFGGGQGIADSFTCAKGMVGEVNSNDGSVDIMHEVTGDRTSKGTRVSIGNGTIEGTVYGGGEIGRVEWNGVVTIGLPAGTGVTSAPVIQGNVFGGGKGVEQYGYAALMRGNTFVTVQADAKVGKSVYGGGEIASVGKYNIVKEEDLTDEFKEAHPGLEVGMPWSLGNEGSGYCNVTIRGNAEIGPDNMKMYYEDGKVPDDEGHVFGAGKGVLPYENEDDFECQYEGHDGAKHPGRMGPGNVWDCYNNDEEGYLTFIETQALATHTEVLVDGNAFVKGSVYGGSLSGHVQHDTHVTIAGDCQIGAGDGINQRYTDYYHVEKWPTETQNIETSWAECAHWDLDVTNSAPYDPYAKYSKTVEGKVRYYYDEGCTEANYANGGSSVATDGHTYYGNVFGGGSGVVPYRPGKWHREAGTVGGNTVVDITGGHILTSVYGGNEHTDVGTYDKTNSRALLANTGKCTINMIGGTIGVPRKSADIALHPVTCYVFGAGKGDSRTNFNTWTNVGETQVNISGNARIYGSTFGGGEDGHVLGDVETNIGGTVTIGGTDHDYPTIDDDNPGVIIGSQGQSGADGNVFGGGRGFSENALTAGVVCGNVTLNIHNGKMLGTVYGGGRLAAVGTYLAAENHANYGKLQPDVEKQAATYYTEGDDIPEGKQVGDLKNAAVIDTHGHISINIDGGIIGATDAQGKLLTSENSIGDVFGGCKGSGNNKHFGLAKKTIITMTGGTVNGNVYGGGELGYVGEATYDETDKVYVWNEENVGGGLCTVGISGGTVAGNVFGAGKGKADDFDCEKALVRTSSVTISGTGTSVGGDVFGGGEVGRVDQNTVVTIGDDNNNGAGTESGAASPTITGSVFGAGAGLETHGYSALVRGNATVTVQGNANVGHSVYGGGEIASVGQYGLDSSFMPETLKGGGDCKVNVKGYAIIGSSGEGHVFGAGMGVDPSDDAHKYIDYTTDPDDKDTKPKRMTKKPAEGKPWPALYENVGDGSEFIWEYYTSQDDYFKFLQTLALATDAYVNVEGNASVHGSVYGGSQSGFVQRETDVKIQGSSKILTTTGTDNKPTNGNVFGGGKGVSGFDKAGRVRGNATTTISGSSTVSGNVYGGGELGFVGKFSVSDDGRDYIWQKITNQAGKEEETGLCTVNINSTSATVLGNVFGAGKGEAETFKCEPAMTKTTSVTISNGTIGTLDDDGNLVKGTGNVYGGGEVGRVDKDTEVKIGLEHYADGSTTYYQKQTVEGNDTYTAATVAKGASVVGKYIRSGEAEPYTYTLIEEYKPVIMGNVFGAGAGLETHGYSALVRGNTTVTVQGDAKVKKNVYGGGEIAAVGKYSLVTKENQSEHPGLEVGMPYALVDENLGECSVTVKDHTEIGTEDGGGDVFGAGMGVDESKKTYTYTAGNTSTMPMRMMIYDPTIYKEGFENPYEVIGSTGYVWEYYPTREKYLIFLQTLALATDTKVSIEGQAKVYGSVYGGSESGFVQRDTDVKIQDQSIIGTEDKPGNVFGGGKGVSGFEAAGRISGDTKVAINGGTINGSVFGGGYAGPVIGDSDVTIGKPYTTSGNGTGGSSTPEGGDNPSGGNPSGGNP